MGNLPLHKEKGVNPRLTVCPRCGGDGSELILVGALDRVSVCKSCGLKHYGHMGCSCQTCGGSLVFDHCLKEGEKLPGSLCESCEKEVKTFQAVVAAGGIYFRCKDCKANGVIKPDHEISKAVRAQSKIEPPNPVGIEFDREHSCPSCGPDKIQEEHS